MAIVTIIGETIKQTEKFNVRCLGCGSNNVEIEIDWNCHPSGDYRKVTLICKDCHIDEVLQDEWV